MGRRKNEEGRIQEGVIRKMEGRYNGQLLCAISNTFGPTSAVSSFIGALCNVKAPYFLLQGFSEAIREMPTETTSVFTHAQVREVQTNEPIIHTFGKKSFISFSAKV